MLKELLMSKNQFNTASKEKLRFGRPNNHEQV